MPTPSYLTIAWRAAVTADIGTTQHARTSFSSTDLHRLRYSNSLRAARSGDRTPVRTRLSTPIQTASGVPPSPQYSGKLVSFPEVKRPGRGVDHPPSSSAAVKERVELHLNSSSGPSSPVAGWTSFHRGSAVGRVKLAQTRLKLLTRPPHRSNTTPAELPRLIFLLGAPFNPHNLCWQKKNNICYQFDTRTYKRNMQLNSKRTVVTRTEQQP